MVDLALTTPSPRRRPYDTAQAAQVKGNRLSQMLTRLNAHLASSLAASAEVKAHGRPTGQDRRFC